jgi:pimeloyl-ACP methyl ester carboxylesterase
VASADGVAIQYESRGRGEPVLVFVHCWCCDRTYWKNQLPRFAKKHKVVAIDLAGHGGSGLNRKTWGPGTYADDVQAVVDKLKLDKMILIGHSMGGPVVVEAANRLAGRVQAIVAVDTLLDVDKKPDPRETGPFLEAMRADFVGTTSNFIRGMMFPEGADPKLVDEIANDMANCPAEVGIASMEGMLRQDLAASLDRIKVPIYCINGDKFPINTEAGKRHAVVFEAEILKGVGHFLQLEKPAEFNRLLEKTIDKIVAHSSS